MSRVIILYSFQSLYMFFLFNSVPFVLKWNNVVLLQIGKIYYLYKCYINENDQIK